MEIEEVVLEIATFSSGIAETVRCGEQASDSIVRHWHEEVKIGSDKHTGKKF